MLVSVRKCPRREKSKRRGRVDNKTGWHMGGNRWTWNNKKVCSGLKATGACKRRTWARPQPDRECKDNLATRRGVKTKVVKGEGDCEEKRGVLVGKNTRRGCSK